jgi:hypothetical protein
MGEIKAETFIRDYGRCLVERRAAVFAGAGLSRAAGFVDWKGLMSGIASDLDLQIDRENDLVALAQYHTNENHGNRAALNSLLIQQFTQDAEETDNHKLIARLPIHTVWTTNYDTLLESSFLKQDKRVDVKVDPKMLAVYKPGTDVTIFKMHGDVSAAYNAVLTKDDYETYAETRELFTIRLKGDLVTQTFLFLGFSFIDPNIEYILSRIRGLLGQDTPTHYCIMKRPVPPLATDGAQRADYEYECRKLSLRVGDLQRYGIQTVLIDEYSEITKILQELNRRAFLKNIFVSGSWTEALETFNLDRLCGFSRLLGKEIIRRGYNLVSGYGWGIGSELIVGALDAADEKFSTLRDRLVLRPFPRSLEDGRKPKIYREWREAMLALSGISIFVAGNKPDPATGQIVVGDGVLQEFEIGSTPPLNTFPIPIGATGYAARQIWETVMSNPGRYYGRLDVKAPLQALGEATITNEKAIEAIFDIVTRCVKADGFAIK